MDLSNDMTWRSEWESEMWSLREESSNSLTRGARLRWSLRGRRAEFRVTPRGERTAEREQGIGRQAAPASQNEAEESDESEDEMAGERMTRVRRPRPRGGIRVHLCMKVAVRELGDLFCFVELGRDFLHFLKTNKKSRLSQ